MAGEDRFARERLVPGWDPDTFAGATAVVVGLGALGNEAAKNLALAGIGRLVLCDPDTVETTNLSRSVLFGPDDIGRPKTEAAAEALRRLSATVVVEPRVRDLAAGVGLGELAAADVVLGCLDSLRSRMRLLGRCALVEAPLVDGATGPWEGEVRLRLDTQEACYGCTLTAHQRSSADVPWSCLDDTTAGQLGTSIGTTALVAAWMTQAALCSVLGTPPPYRMLRIESLTGRTAPVVMTRARDCPHHRPIQGDITPCALNHRATAGELTAVLPFGGEPLTWSQFPLPVRCRACRGYAETVGDRAVADTPFSRCDQCGRLRRPRFSNRLRDAAPDARLTELGVPPQEILPVRQPRGEYTWHQLSS
ncbi:ThiF family adenylyltransferase [Streptomyces sp. ISL-98]|uniref:ThiF family adenylyltransferase n=1 Tax=Streptomyces sp. ISL-98 TaxID=2819192 RepID=UPI001BE93797|nr:ThiF family adenylyltransferase [Streptomyces sp. ISL-98]MBT2510189.1 ThiF family adenylyltransferase [Streptomyces sp. ISL-98]